MHETQLSRVNPLAGGGVRASPWWKSRGLACFLGYVVVLSAVFLIPLERLFGYALREELHSHILLVPFVFLYLCWLKMDLLQGERRGSMAMASLFAAGAAAVFFGFDSARVGAWSVNDQLARMVVCYVLLVIAGGFLFLGTTWMRVLAFPFCMLFFLVPLPDMAVAWLEDLLVHPSAMVADWGFRVIGTPVHRAGQVIELPGMALEVARECSGIRSTLVLFITSLIAAHLLLSSGWHRMILVALVIPLGILRNAMRIFVIGLLCVHGGPHMIDSWIHRHGGPVFFAATLVPFLAVAAWFRHREKAPRAGRGRANLASAG